MKTYYLDQRETPRIIGPVNLTLFVIPEDAEEPAYEVGERMAMDVSEGGLKVHVEQDLPREAVLEVRLQPGSGIRPIMQFGFLRWKHQTPDRPGFDVGIQFMHTTRSDHDAWLAYVHDQLDKVRS